MEYLTDHVIQTVSNDIVTRMYNHRLDTPKYIKEDIIEDDTDNDSEMNNISINNDNNDNNNKSENSEN